VTGRAGLAAALLVTALACGCAGDDGGGRVEVVSPTSSAGAGEAIDAAALEAQQSPGATTRPVGRDDDVCAWVDADLADRLRARGAPVRSAREGAASCSWDGGAQVDVQTTDGRASALAALERWQLTVTPRDAVNDLGEAAVLAEGADGRVHVAVVGGETLLTVAAPRGVDHDDVVGVARTLWTRHLAR